MLTLILCVAVLSAQASALAFRGPQATSQAEAGDLVFPPEPTAAPKVHPDLFRRQDVKTDLIAPDNTCGYISGLEGTCSPMLLRERVLISFCTEDAYYCEADTDTCFFFPGTSTTYGLIGCCNIAQSYCGVRTTCINSVEYYSSSICDSDCEGNTYILKW